MNKIYILIAITLVTISNLSHAKHYYRFWRGHIEPKMTEEKFVEGLNRLFIPETFEQGRGFGLISYLPVMITRSVTAKEFPDELALVVYESEKKYMDIRKMPRGDAYQKSHWVYFDKNKSKSLVPEKFVRLVQMNKAYDLLESNSQWIGGKVQYLMRKFKNGFNVNVSLALVEYFSEIQKNAKKYGVTSHLVLIDELGIYEYILYDKNASPQAQSLLQHNEISNVMNIGLKDKNIDIGFGEGVNRN